MVRYYGSFANRKHGMLLPKDYNALEMTVRENRSAQGSRC